MTAMREDTLSAFCKVQGSGVCGVCVIMPVDRTFFRSQTHMNSEWQQASADSSCDIRARTHAQTLPLSHSPKAVPAQRVPRARSTRIQ